MATSNVDALQVTNGTVSQPSDESEIGNEESGTNSSQSSTSEQPQQPNQANLDSALDEYHTEMMPGKTEVCLRFPDFQEKIIYLFTTLSVGDVIEQIKEDLVEIPDIVVKLYNKDGILIVNRTKLDHIIGENHVFYIHIGPSKNRVAVCRSFSRGRDKGFLYHMQLEEPLRFGANISALEGREGTPRKRMELYKEMKEDKSFKVEFERKQYYNLGQPGMIKGIVLAINVVDFKREPQRKYIFDFKDVSHTFTKLGFQVVWRQSSYDYKQELEGKQVKAGKEPEPPSPSEYYPGDASIEDILDQELKNIPIYEQMYGMFVLIILTHGNDGTLSNADSTTTELANIYRKLEPNDFPLMAGRPKLVILGTCSGPGRAEVHQIQPQSDKHPSDKGKHQGAVTQRKWKDYDDNLRVAGEDICTWFASSKGKVSFSDENSSFFIRAIAETLCKHAHHADLHELFEQITEKVKVNSMDKERSRQERAESMEEEPSRLKKLWNSVRGISQRHPQEECVGQLPTKTDGFAAKLCLFPNLERYTVDERTNRITWKP